MSNADTNTAFLRLSRRAEAVDRSKLIQTFVDIGPLFTLLSSRDHQILFGRRGTGKTHALMYLMGAIADHGDVPVYIDMRRVGSTGGIYGDPSIPIRERATRLLMDTLAAIHEQLLNFALDADEGSLNLSQLGPRLDELATASTEVRVVGTIQVEQTCGLARSTERHSEVDISASVSGVPLHVGGGRRRQDEEEHWTRSTESGDIQHRVHFGRVGTALERVVEGLPGRHVWIALDEWSVVPMELQPYLSDLIRRSILPTPGFTVKIGAIEQRTALKVPQAGGDYLGIEVGADAAADVNLDDFMVFENDPGRSKTFFSELIFKHYLSAAEELALAYQPKRASQLTQLAFTQDNTFEELVRASEGVPRDAINILAVAAQRAGDNPISIDQVRAAARTWYQRDKEAAVSANPRAEALLHWIIDQVIAHRRARAFLLRSDANSDLIDALFDARVLHLLKRNVSTHDQPGVRYNVFKIDFGCYVDLLTTVRTPKGLLPGGDSDSENVFFDVPPEDYRAIRRAILDLADFSSSIDSGRSRIELEE